MNATGIARSGTATRPAGDAAADRWDVIDLVVVLCLAVPVLVYATSGVEHAILGGSAPASVRSALVTMGASTVGYIVVTLLAIVILFLRHRTTLAHLGWVLPERRWLGFAVPIAAGTIVLTGEIALISQALFHGASNAQCTSLRSAFGSLLVLAVPVVVIIAPICEETLFRGFLYQWLRRRMPWGAAAITDGLLFAGAHRSLLLLLPLAVGGVILAALYQYSRSVWPGVVVHVFINLSAMVLLLSATSC